MARDMQLRLVIGADGRAVAPVTAEVRREVSGVGDAGRAAAADLGLLALANDEAAAASRRAMEAIRGQSQAERELRASIDRSVGVRPALNDNQYRERQADIAAYGAELDRLRARFVPAAAAEQSLLAVQNDINRAFQLGAIDAKEQASALEAARLAHDRTAAAAAAQAEEYRRLAAAGREAWAADQEQSRVNSLLGVGGASAGSARASADVFEAAGMFEQISAGADGAARSTALATHEMTNLTYQMNDIVMMLVSGQSFGIIMAQQGAQVAQIMGPRGLGEILPAIGGALAKLISPTTMFFAGITAAGYAGYYAFRRIIPEAKNAADVLTRHADLVRDIEQSYTQATNAADRFGRESQSILLYQAEQAKRELADLLTSGAKDTYVNQLGPGMFGFEALDIKQYLPADWIGQASTLGPIYDAIMRLNEEAKSGVPNFAAYRQVLVAIANDRTLSASIRERADALLKESEELAKLHRQWRGFRADVSSTGMLFGRALQEAHSLNDLGVYQSEMRVNARRAEEAFGADMLGLTARSPAERAAAARAQAAASYNTSEHPDERSLRIDLAERRALAEAEHSLAEATQDRAFGLKETLAAARLDLDLVGKSAAEVDRLRMEHQLLSELRREAAQNGVEASQQEIDAIRAVAAETAQLRAVAGARELIRTKAEELDMLRIEAELVGASSSTKAQLLAQIEAEREIRERGIHTLSREAQEIRAYNSALAEQKAELEQLRDGWSSVQRAGESMIDNVLSRLVDGDWENAIKSISDEILKLTMQLAVINPLKNALLGTNYGTFGGLGGWGGIASGLFGASVFTGFERAWTAAVPGLYDKGGPTGGSDPSRIAGFVHEQEYVFDAKSTRRIGIGNLDAIRRGALGGYREGGYAVTTGAQAGHAALAGPMPGLTVNVQNNGAQVEVGQPQQTGDGGVSLDVIVNQLEGRMEKSMRSGRLGTAAQQTFGLSRRTR